MPEVIAFKVDEIRQKVFKTYNCDQQLVQFPYLNIWITIWRKK